MVRPSWGLLFACVAAGCFRLVSPGTPADPPSQPTGANGSPCASALACISGHCVEDVCCERDCLVTESCAQPDTKGTCVPRPPGAPCSTDAGQCPSGHCVDGVCCNSECVEPCHQCNAPGQPGTCAVVDFNHDPRGECAGPCQACFGGVCAPALIGTNPKENVDGAQACPAAQACNLDGACKPALAQACVVQSTEDTASAECATQNCLADVCLWPASEVVPPTIGNPDAHTRQLMDAVMAEDGTPFLLLREVQFDTSATRSGSTGPYSFAKRKVGLTLAARNAQGWRGWPLADLSADGAGADTGGDTLGQRFRRLLQLRSAPPGVVMLAHVRTETGVVSSPLLAAALGAQNCGLLATWFYGDFAGGGRRCLLPTVTNPRGEPGVLQWFSAELIEGTHFALALATYVNDVSELSLLDCPAATCLPAKSLATDDLGAQWPGLLVLESGRPIVFHFPDTLDRVRAVDGNSTAEVLLAPGCDLGQLNVGATGGWDLDHPARSLSALRVLRGGQPRWQLTVLCTGAVGTVLYDPVTRTFDGQVQAVESPAGDIVGASPFALPGNRDALLIARDQSLAAAWNREEGSAVFQRLIPSAMSGSSVRATWAGNQDGLPVWLWETTSRRPVNIPGVSSLEAPVRTETVLRYQHNAQ